MEKGGTVSYLINRTKCFSTTKAVTHGPLIAPRAADKVDQHVKDAVSKGGKIVVGGRTGKGSYYPPTLVIDGPRDAVSRTSSSTNGLLTLSISQFVSEEETFGPAAFLTRFETETEVLIRFF